MRNLFLKKTAGIFSCCLLFFLPGYGQKIKIFNGVPPIIRGINAGFIKGIYDQLWMYPEAGDTIGLYYIVKDSVGKIHQASLGFYKPTTVNYTLDSLAGNIIFLSDKFGSPISGVKGAIATVKNNQVINIFNRSIQSGLNPGTSSNFSNLIFNKFNQSIYLTQSNLGIYRKHILSDSTKFYQISDFSSGNFVSDLSIIGYDRKILTLVSDKVNIIDPITNTSDIQNCMLYFGVPSPFEIFKLKDSSYALPCPTGLYVSRKKVVSQPISAERDSLGSYSGQVDKRGVFWSSHIKGKKILSLIANNKLRVLTIKQLGIPENEFIFRVAVDTLNNKWLAGLESLYKLTDINPKLRVKEIYQGCNADSLVFTDSSTTIGEGIAKRIWKFSDGFSATTGPNQNIIKHRFTSLGNQWATVTVVDTNGSKDKDSINVSVLNLSTVSINTRPVLETCKNIVTLTSQGASNPKWYAAPANFLFSGSTLTVTQPGKYILRDSIKIGNQTCIRQDTVRIIKKPASIGSLEISNSTNGNTISSDTIFSNNIKSILISGTPQGSTFSMVVNGDNLKKNPAIVSTDSLDKLEIFFTVKDQDSCQFLASKTLYIKTYVIIPDPPKPPFILNLPNLITANDDGRNDQFENKDQSFPAGYTLEIFNRWGKSIFKKENYKNEWPDESLLDGSYFYLLAGVDGEKYSGWVMVER